MDHLAILNKKWKLLDKIISGEKTIESRWYKSRKTPYDKIKKGDTVYFKNSGEQVTTKATVSKVIYYEDLSLNKIKEILKQYGEQTCVPISYVTKIEGKKYCILIFLDKAEQIKPFNVDKTGYGLMSAWITLDNINTIKK